MAAARIRPFVCNSCRSRLASQSQSRAFNTSTTRRADPPSTREGDDPILSGLGGLSKQMQQSRTRQPPARPKNPEQNPYTYYLDATPESLITDEAAYNLDNQQTRLPHRLHVYSHKHNTHITLVQPPRSKAETASARVAGTKATSAEQKKTVDTLLSMSTGNIGFRKANRSSYDAAFQLTAFVMKQMEERGIWRDVHKLEVVLRGFGAGREAVTKAILGSEGRHARPRISSVVDATRLKQGGPRSKKPRRLG